MLSLSCKKKLSDFEKNNIEINKITYVNNFFQVSLNFKWIERVSVTQEKGNKQVCELKWGVSLLLVVGKFYIDAFRDRVVEVTLKGIGEDYVSGKTKRFSDQIFLLRHTCEKVEE